MMSDTDSLRDPGKSLLTRLFAEEFIHRPIEVYPDCPLTAVQKKEGYDVNS